jgi:SAM-dependent methyltransferase
VANSESDKRKRARELAHAARLEGNPSAWFEVLYREAGGNPGPIPWADGVVNPNLTAWLEENPQTGEGRKALVVGCGLGDDAELLAESGFDVTAFDVSPTAVEWCRKRFPNSSVSYVVADAFQLPREWRGQFAFVLEAYTLQALPPEFREQAMRSIAGTVARGGMLLVICRACDPQDERAMLPWPLTLDELTVFEECGLRSEEFEDFVDESGPQPVRRFRITYRRG